MERNWDTPRARERYLEAKRELPKNVWRLPQFSRPVLTCGQGYPGIWLEHNLDNVFYAAIDPEVAVAGHEIFFEHQRGDGLLPAYVRRPQTGSIDIGYGHVQAVIAPALTAWQVAQVAGQEAFLKRAYDAYARYDAWFVAHRDHGRRGLVEMYCEYDTGHDNSPRVNADGIPRACPGNDAVNMPDIPWMPVGAPDLSAMLYGGRTALAEMAGALGLPAEAQRWLDLAEETRENLLRHCWDDADGFFYDVDARGVWRKFRSEHITRLFANRVVEPARFERIYQRYFKDPNEFAAPYPFPSLSLSDPNHDRRYPKNSWGGQSQALTALRACLWMEFYGKKEDFRKFMEIWVRAVAESPLPFTQEMNPNTGLFTDCAPYYTPTLLLYLDFMDRLDGKETVSSKLGES
ncbi:MAG: alpha-L-rhamnosidase [Spirochaetes bacterium]|nr:alpha-L-rhamnosidase [Spirochaetota bacterium]